MFFTFSQTQVSCVFACVHFHYKLQTTNYALPLNIPIKVEPRKHEVGLPLALNVRHGAFGLIISFLCVVSRKNRPRLKKDDLIVGVDLIDDGKVSSDEQLMVVMANGFGKRTAVASYKVQGRGGSGIKTSQVTAKTGEIASAKVVSGKAETEDMIIISKKGQVIRMSIKSVSVLGRATQGVRLMKFKDPSDHVSSVTLI